MLRLWICGYNKRESNFVVIIRERATCYKEFCHNDYFVGPLNLPLETKYVLGLSPIDLASYSSFFVAT